MIGDTPFVNDLRTDSDPSLQVVPRIRSLAELNVWCDAGIDRSKGWDATASGLVWRCIGFNLQTGPAVFTALFNDVNGNPVADTLVVHSWSGAPALNNVAMLPDYSGQKGVAGFTNSNGNVWFGYSGGMVYVNGQDVGIIWPLCPTHLAEPKYADCAKGLGWFGGTDHLTVNPVFQLVRKGLVGPSPDPVPIEGTFLRVVIGGVEVGIIPIIQRPNPVEANALEVYVGHIFVGDVRF